MTLRNCLLLVLLAVTPAWSQVKSAGATSTFNPDDADLMQLPPLINARPFPVLTGSEVTTNSVNLFLSAQPAYNDNVLVDYGTKPIGSPTYSVQSNMAIDRTTPLFHVDLGYLPGFTVFQRVNARSAAYQTVGLHSEYRVTPQVTASISDSFHQSSDVFEQLASPSAISGSVSAPPNDIIPPFADRIRNSASGELTDQYAQNAMVGVGGSTSFLEFPDPAQAPDLYNSGSWGGSGFFNRRLNGTQYAGAIYLYTKILEFPPSGVILVHTQNFMAYYSALFPSGLSISIAAGPQRFDLTDAPLPASASWTPAVMGSIAWQTDRFNVAATGSRMVSGGGGLLGNYQTSTVHALTRWRTTRYVSLQAGVNYTSRNNVSPLYVRGFPGGSSVSGMASLGRSLTEHMDVKVGYARAHYAYPGVVSLSADPNVDRVFASFTYNFKHPLGR
ncbi:MAG: hypothetical protein ACRD3N_03020 [Terracidiphilus sp.]